VSFRNRLTLFFVFVVIVPMVAMAVILFRLIDDNESSKADARVAARQETAVNLYRESRTRSARVADRVGRDRVLAGALRDGRRADAADRARELLRELGAVRIRVADRERDELVDAGSREAVAPDARELVTANGRPFGLLQVSARSAAAYAQAARRLTGLHVVVRTRIRLLASTLRGVPDRPLPDVGTISVRDEDFRVASFTDRGFGRDRIRVAVLDRRAPTSDAVARSRVLAAALLAGFFLLAIICAVLVSRGLQAQIGGFLDAARRLGRGDFSAQVPTEGRDEFAALGEEFNRMARQLEGRLEELRRERSRLETSLRRVGEVFATKLDRTALLDLAVGTTVDGVAADGGRARLLHGADGALQERASSSGPEDLEEIVAAAEAEALVAGEPREVTTEAGSALAHPLHGTQDDAVTGTVSVWRRGRAFLPSERELFHYLAGQTGVSMENVALHETVQRQAITDELTGLYNHRRFQEGLATELERGRRFEQSTGLVLMDIDDFKRVNDTYGHQTGDRVLADVARALRDESREIDEPARYGGEELAVVLPGADLEGAYQLAERVRRAVAALEWPLDDGRPPLQVTASFGAAAVPESARDQATLIAAADSALYAAKRSGKNRTVRAEADRAGR